ncbi:PRC-barrel domain protein [Clostridium tepidiprofundi DSM 19306]|uniref:PRC-barrel domain protein n=1 Tax=Clostridium tepidiprofundi DSM 19306 TaxID=1121338 RepID=A0A151B7C4_9CLOT|nr:YlmC/YmxH family sporulation protein [Clostridium tepidiprofundi]KYH35784.1 PRC-barrel domain protein [Clostridium tepidiprofundi DSM 19306]
MEINNKYYSEMEKFEIININDGDKYDYLGNNDIIVDEQGNLKALILNCNRSKFSLFSKDEFKEIEWDCVKKIGYRTIIIDVEYEELK